jgi:F-type H+-transporting ATPase subunit delta
MNESIISVRYTKALFQLSKEKGLLDIVFSDMKTLFQFMNESEELQYVFQNPVLKPSKKEEIIDQVFKSFNPLTTSFIKLLIKNRREEHLHDISRNFLDFYSKDKGIENAVFTTSIFIDIEIANKLKSLLQKSLNAEVELTSKVDQKLIGGFILTIGDKQYDASVQSNLKKLKRKLLDTPVS